MVQRSFAIDGNETSHVKWPDDQMSVVRVVKMLFQRMVETL